MMDVAVFIAAVIISGALMIAMVGFVRLLFPYFLLLDGQVYGPRK